MSGLVKQRIGPAAIPAPDPLSTALRIDASHCLLGWSLRAFTLINTLCCCPGSKQTSSLAPNLRCVGVRLPATTLALGPAGALALIHEVRRHPRKPKGAICELVAGP